MMLPKPLLGIKKQQINYQTGLGQEMLPDLLDPVTFGDKELLPLFLIYFSRRAISPRSSLATPTPTKGSMGPKTSTFYIAMDMAFFIYL